MHEKYGPIVRFGPNSVSINSASALKTIYGHKSNVKKGIFYTSFPPTKDTFNTHSSIDKAAHARKRRVLSHAFSENAVKSMERYVLGNIRTFCEKLGTQPSTQVLGEKESNGWSVAQNMADWCNYLTFDVMGDLCFGKAFEMLEHKENRHVIDLIGNAAHMHLIVGYQYLPTMTELTGLKAGNKPPHQETQPPPPPFPRHFESSHAIHDLLQGPSNRAN
jgi:cytochrome P450